MKFLSAGTCYIFLNNFLCFHLRILFNEGIVGHFLVKIAKNGRTPIIFRLV